MIWRLTNKELEWILKERSSLTLRAVFCHLSGLDEWTRTEKTVDSWSRSEPDSSATVRKVAARSSFSSYDVVQNQCRLPPSGILPSSNMWADRKLKKGGDSRDTIPTPALHWMAVDVTSPGDWWGQGTYQMYRTSYTAELFPISVQHKPGEINDSVMSPSSRSANVTHLEAHSPPQVFLNQGIFEIRLILARMEFTQSE
jgi:hypothetical protein